jgi:hypothetical protein
VALLLGTDDFRRESLHLIWRGPDRGELNSLGLRRFSATTVGRLCGRRCSGQHKRLTRTGDMTTLPRVDDRHTETNGGAATPTDQGPSVATQSSLLDLDRAFARGSGARGRERSDTGGVLITVSIMLATVRLATNGFRERGVAVVGSFLSVAAGGTPCPLRARGGETGAEARRIRAGASRRLQP